MNCKFSKKALVASVLSLVLCFAMLLGTTFAWFTDKVTTGANQIISGNLEVLLLDENDQSLENSTTLFRDKNGNTSNLLWEPNATFKTLDMFVKNNGNLALKYKLILNVTGQDAAKLLEVLAVTVTVGDTTVDLDDFEGKLMPAETSDAIVITTHMDKNADESYENLKAELSLTVLATQLAAEFDSLGNDYDADAPFIPEWDGDAGELPDEQNNVITITTAEELAAFANAVNGVSSVSTYSTAGTGESFAGKTIRLAADINLGNMAWTPIGSCDTAAYFQGTFDGQGHTIYGLNVDRSTDEYMYSTAGLFGWIDAGKATIKNVVIDGATVKGSHWVGAIAGFMTGDILNCKVINSTVIGYNVNGDANGDKVGGVVGYMNTGAGRLEGNSVSNTTVIGYRDVGGVAGAVATTNSVKNNSVNKIVVAAEADYVGEIVSAKTAVVVDGTNVATEASVTKGVLVAEGVIMLAEKSYAVTDKKGLLNVNEIIQSTATGEGCGIKVTLMADIDLAGEIWRPIDKMWIEFDGNGHTISNLKAEAWKAGLFGYVGGGYIKNLTLENVDVTGAQAGAFAGAIEGTIDNCVLKGENKITYVPKHQYDDPNEALEAWGGIGAISGITQPCTVNATIAEGAVVTLDYGEIETEAPYVDVYTGYIGTNKGTVTDNGKVVVIKKATAASNEELTSAISGGATNITLTDGEYKMPSSGTTGSLTIVGTKDAVLDVTKGAYMDQANVTIKGITIKTGTDYVQDENGNKGSDYAALYSPNTTYVDCTFVGPMRVGRDGAKFINCTFTELGNDYVWTYGNDVTFEGCKFYTDGKAILIYSDGGSEVSLVSVKNCEFYSTAGATAWAIANQNCAAIEIHNYGNGVDLVTEGNTYDANFSGEWRIKTYETGKQKIVVNGVEYTTIAVDGKLMTIDADRNVTVAD